MINPFRYGIVVDDPYFIDREQELSDFKQWLTSCQSVILYSPRRYGKTSLILKVLRELTEEGYTTVYIDFFKVHSRFRFIELYYNTIVKAMPVWEKAIQKLNIILKTVRPVISLDNHGNPNISVRLDPHSKTEDMSEVFDLPQKLAGNKPWIVVFDEFQEVNKLNGESFEKEMRASLIHQDKVSYVFMGSQMHMLLNMFKKPNRAFYQFGKIIELKKIPDNHMLEYLKRGFRETGIKSTSDLHKDIINISNNIPHYVQYLGSAAWELSLENHRIFDESVLKKAIGKIVNNQNDYFLAQYESLTSYQQKVLKAIREKNSNVFTKDYSEQYHLSPVSSTQRALERLMKEGILEKQENIYQFTDPFFKIWLKDM